MKVIVSDTTTITNLFIIGYEWILSEVYQMIFIPRAVYNELSVIKSQKEWIDNQSWIEIIDVTSKDKLTYLTGVLDGGEVEAISLALNINADWLIIDEAKGRKVAQNLGINIVGLIGVLLIAKEEKVIERIEPLLDSLVKSQFRISDQLKEYALREANEWSKD